MDYNSVIILLVLLVAGSIFVGHFTGNITTIIVESSMYGFVALGLSFVMLTGGIDLSVGFQLGCASVMTVLILNATGSVALAFIIGILTGVVTGVINGLTVVTFGINSLIGTMATMYIFEGFAYYFTKNGSPAVESELKAKLQNSLAHNVIGGYQLLTLTVIIFAAVLVFFWFMMRRTRFGISLYITGDNEEAGRFAGINTDRVRFLAFVICGVCCAVGGIIFASNAGTTSYTHGLDRNVFAMSACIIGGIKMTGGKGTVINVLMGVLIMRSITMILNLLLIPSQIYDLISGALLIGVLIIGRATTTKKELDNV